MEERYFHTSMDVILFFIVNFEHISHLFLALFLFSLNKKMLAGKSVVGHVPATFFKVLFKFLRLLNSILIYIVTKTRMSRGSGHEN